MQFDEGGKLSSTSAPSRVRRVAYEVILYAVDAIVANHEPAGTQGVGEVRTAECYCIASLTTVCVW